MLDMRPGDPALMLELSYVESLAGRYRQALDWTRRVEEGGAGLRGETALSLLRRLRTFNELSALQRLAMHWLQAGVEAQVLVECASQLSNANDHAAALRCAEAAVVQAPSALAPKLIRGQVLGHFGHVDAAAADFEWVLARAPGAASAWWALARLRKQSPQSNHVVNLQRLLATQGMKPLDQSVTAYALHKELDDLGDADGAWQALQQACTIKRGTLNHASDDTRALVDALIAMPVAATAEVAPIGGKLPIFIVGMHRSGTTLLEQLLDGSPDVRGVGELYDFTSAMRYATDHHCAGVMDARIPERAVDVDFGEVGKRYLDGVAWRLEGQEFFIDKLPSNFLNTGFICEALPQAKVLHMVRDPMETCFSNLRELFSDANPYSYDQLELADFFNEYRGMMAHWHARYPGRILDVDYARLTREPEGEIRRVCDFIGTAFEPKMLQLQSRTRGIVTASAVQVRGHIEVRETPKWRAYEKHLQPLLQRLGG